VLTLADLEGRIGVARRRLPGFKGLIAFGAANLAGLPGRALTRLRFACFPACFTFVSASTNAILAWANSLLARFTPFLARRTASFACFLLFLAIRASRLAPSSLHSALTKPMRAD
jgi:hypothetical protein